MGLSGRARGAIVAGSLVAVICLPVPGAAVGVVSGTAVSSPGPSGPTSPGQQPKPPPPPPPPPAHQPTTWPVQSGDRGPLVAWVQQRLIWLAQHHRRPVHSPLKQGRAGVEPKSARLFFGTVALAARLDEQRPNLLLEKLDLVGRNLRPCCPGIGNRQSRQQQQH